MKVKNGKMGWYTHNHPAGAEDDFGNLSKSLTYGGFRMWKTVDCALKIDVSSVSEKWGMNLKSFEQPAGGCACGFWKICGKRTLLPLWLLCSWWAQLIVSGNNEHKSIPLLTSGDTESALLNALEHWNRAVTKKWKCMKLDSMAIVSVAGLTNVFINCKFNTLSNSLINEKIPQIILKVKSNISGTATAETVTVLRCPYELVSHSSLLLGNSEITSADRE